MHPVTNSHYKRSIFYNVLCFTMLFNRPDTLKIGPHVWGFWTPSNTCLLGSTGVNIPNSILISSAAFAWRTIVTDRRTHRPRYSVTIGRICVYCDAA